jgi:sugar lactone lactonase YvrE
VRRVLIASAVAVILFGAVAFPQNEENSTNSAPNAIQPLIIAQGFAARSLAIGSQNVIYATVDPTDRVFDLTSSLAVSSKDPSRSLIPIAGTGALGSLGDGGAATSAQFALNTNSLYERSGIAVASDGAIYIADTENSTIRRIAGQNSSEPGVVRSIVGRWAPAQNLTVGRPMGIALDHSGNLYIADQQAGALEVLRQDSGLLETLAQISSPASVAVMPDGTEAFVSSPSVGAVFAVGLHTHSIRQIQAMGNQGSSAADSATPPCSPGSNRVCPSGLAVDGAGNLFVADSTFGRILRIDARTGSASVVMNNLQQPGALAFDQQRRNLYVAEQGLNRVIEAQNLGSPSGNLSLSPPSWTFPNEPMGGISALQQFTLTNNSASTISGLQIASPPMPSVGADFSLQSTSCLPTLSAGASCTIDVAFTPKSSTATQFNPVSSTVSVTDSSSDSASSSVSGTADDYQLQLANGQPLEVSVFAGSAATFNLQAVSLGAFGQNGEQVAITCPNDTPPQSVCTLNPATVSPKPGSPATFTLKIQTSSNLIQADLPPGNVTPSSASAAELMAIVSILTLIGIALLSVAKGRFRYAAIPVLAFGAAVLLNGCHHASAIAKATPPGTTQILIQGSALSQSGASLNATRGLTVTLDVVKN